MGGEIPGHLIDMLQLWGQSLWLQTVHADILLKSVQSLEGYCLSLFSMHQKYSHHQSHRKLALTNFYLLHLSPNPGNSASMSPRTLHLGNTPALTPREGLQHSSTKMHIPLNVETTQLVHSSWHDHPVNVSPSPAPFGSRNPDAADASHLGATR